MTTWNTTELNASNNSSHPISTNSCAPITHKYHTSPLSCAVGINFVHSKIEEIVIILLCMLQHISIKTIILGVRVCWYYSKCHVGAE